ncbi:MAG: hypothetical protein HRT45_15535 [Bdellovibrionales bacterium]|nr:hypothetical protein [Bdellovibrionales bacterium]
MKRLMCLLALVFPGAQASGKTSAANQPKLADVDNVSAKYLLKNGFVLSSKTPEEHWRELGVSGFKELEVVEVNKTSFLVLEQQKRRSKEGSLKTPKGVLQFRDFGEFGGKLFLEGKEDTPIAEENFSAAFMVGDQVYAFGGLAHLHIDRGYLWILEATENGFGVAKKIDLGGKPRPILEESGGVFTYVANDGLYQVKNESVAKLTSLNIKGLYANSLLRQGSTYLVGMRSSVGVIEPGAKNEFLFFTEDPEFLDKLKKRAKTIKVAEWNVEFSLIEFPGWQVSSQKFEKGRLEVFFDWPPFILYDSPPAIYATRVEVGEGDPLAKFVQTDLNQVPLEDKSSSTAVYAFDPSVYTEGYKLPKGLWNHLYVKRGDVAVRFTFDSLNTDFGMQPEVLATHLATSFIVKED